MVVTSEQKAGGSGGFYARGSCDRGKSIRSSSLWSQYTHRTVPSWDALWVWQQLSHRSMLHEPMVRCEHTLSMPGSEW